ncbi:hypothetical protein [Vulcanococcus sp.]|uniref:hypothetical protein n=1 Tax=Vulcanococcus sp. TaxID=2856995 RepID=UPI0037DA36DC
MPSNFNFPLREPLLLALAVHAAVLTHLLTRPTVSPGSRQADASGADTPTLLRLSRRLQVTPPSAPALPINPDAVALPPPPPPFDAFPQRPVPVPNDKEVPDVAAESGLPRSAPEVLRVAAAWLTPPRDGFDAAEPRVQAVRQRQWWLTARQAVLLQGLWEAADERQQEGSHAWRAMTMTGFRSLGLPFQGASQVHGISLVHQGELTLLWRDSTGLWMVRPVPEG